MEESPQLQKLGAEATNISEISSNPPSEINSTNGPALTTGHPHKPVKSSRHTKATLIAVVALILLAGGVAAAYLLGNNHGKKTVKTPVNTASREIMVPQGATVIADCVEKRGAQYILPKDIPNGPIYDVHDGKVVGIEYMVEKDKLPIMDAEFLNYDLFDHTYDHILIGNVPHGHAGLTTDHYHLDFMLIPTAESDMITCAAGDTHNPTHTDMGM